MQLVIEEVCQNLRNWFLKHDGSDVVEGDFTIASGILYHDGEIMPQTGYFRIQGSTLNDGVYLGGTDTLTDEVFTGAVWYMHLPAAFVSLCNDIKAWQTANGAADSANMSPYSSESFGGYSYSKGGGVNGATAVTWQAQFRSRLNAWRKI